MTRDEMMKFLRENPNVRITHFLFDPDEYIISKENGLVYDENDYLFEDWTSQFSLWNGIRIRTGGLWENGWTIKE